jgi:hypothetical protein
MPIRIIPAPLTVFDEQNFISRHFVSAVLPDTGTVTLSSYSITTAATPVGANFATGVTVSIAGSSLTISGRYRNVFVNDRWTIRGQERNTSLSTYTSISDIPAAYFAAVEFQADQRLDIDVNINIVTDKGSTSLTQTVRNDWSLKRNRFIDIIYAGQIDTNSINRNQDLGGPVDIDSDEINTAYVFTTSISTNVINYNLYDDALLAGWNGITPLLATVTVNAGVYVYSTNTGTAGFDTGGAFPAGSNVVIINNGFILGRGGTGAGANPAGGNSTVVAQNGSPAMNINYPVNITNNNYIAGGGGGGGGVRDIFSSFISGGGGGAGGGQGGWCRAGTVSRPGGAGGGPGQVGGNGVVQSFESLGSISAHESGGGGGRILPGVGGVGGSGAGVPPVAGGGGAGGGGGGTYGQSPFGDGFYSTGGNGGSGNSPGSTGPLINDGGAGGGGGGWGAAGAPSSARGGVYETFNVLQGTGGKAVNLNGNTVTFAITGTIWGAVS